MANPLPLISLLNNVRIVSNYLYASQQIGLTSYITKNYPSLATEFQDWQQDIFDEYFEGFLSENLTAQPAVIYQYYSDGMPADAIQGLAQSTLITDGVTPGLITSADNVSSLINKGAAFVTQLTTIAKGIENADQQQVDTLTQQANQLSSQFDSEEDQIVEGSFKLGEDVVVTAVNIAIAAGSEGEDLEPVIKSVSQVGTDIADEITLSDEAKATIAQLQTTWASLDAATSALAQITLMINQLTAVTQDTSATLTALDNIVTEWQQVADSTNMSAADWASYGNAAMQEWASRMVTVSFATATQTVS